MSSKLELDFVIMCSWHHLVKAIEVTAGLAESNGSLSLAGWLKKLPAG